MQKGKTKLSDHSQHDNFDQLLLEAIDEGLSELGEAGKISIYIYLESCFNIRKQEMPNRLIDFSNALERIFGVGARHLEISIMKNLRAKLEATFKGPKHEWPLFEEIVPEITFSEHVSLLRKIFNDAKGNEFEIGILANEHAEFQK
jgi:hypothetical protein